MRITEIRVTYHLPLQEADRETADRVLQVHPSGCPAHQSVVGCIRFQIGAEYELR